MKTNTTLIMSSLVVATILVVGALVLPYNYAMASRHLNIKSSFDPTSIKVSIEKKIKQAESHERGTTGGDANGGAGGSSKGGAGGSSNWGAGGRRGRSSRA